MPADDAVDLEGARERLEAERDQLAAQERRLRAESDDEEWQARKPDEADQGTAAVERERLRSLADQTQERLRRVDRALRRVEAGTYGRCEGCGEAIPTERLEARPDAERCVQCAATEASRAS